MFYLIEKFSHQRVIDREFQCFRHYEAIGYVTSKEAAERLVDKHPGYRYRELEEIEDTG